jgi:hypothetical protein
MNPLNNPLVVKMIGTLLRMSLGGLAFWLTSKGVLEPGQEEAFYAGLTTIVLAIGWAVWKNVRSLREFNTAAGSNKAMSPEVVKAMVAGGVYAPASTPVTSVPNVKSPEERL